MYGNSRMNHHLAIWIYCLAAGLSGLGHASGIPLTQAEERPSYRFGVFPYMPPARLEKAYAPVAAAFGRALGRPVQLGTAGEIDKFRIRLKKGDFKIALIAPMDVMRFVDEGEYIPLARRPSHPASIVVLEESPLQQAADLRHKTLGLPPAGWPPSVIIQLMLNEQGLMKDRDIRLRYFTNVVACLHQLLVKTVDACGSGGGAALKVFQKKMGVNLRVLMKTPSYPHHLFVTHPRLLPAEREILSRTILGWEKTEEGRELLRTIGPGARFIPFRSADYDIIRNYYRRWEENVQNAP